MGGTGALPAAERKKRSLSKSQPSSEEDSDDDDKLTKLLNLNLFLRPVENGVTVQKDKRGKDIIIERHHDPFSLASHPQQKMLDKVLGDDDEAKLKYIAQSYHGVVFLSLNQDYSRVIDLTQIQYHNGALFPVSKYELASIFSLGQIGWGNLLYASCYKKALRHVRDDQFWNAQRDNKSEYLVLGTGVCVPCEELGEMCGIKIPGTNKNPCDSILGMAQIKGNGDSGNKYPHEVFLFCPKHFKVANKYDPNKQDQRTVKAIPYVIRICQTILAASNGLHFVEQIKLVQSIFQPRPELLTACLISAMECEDWTARKMSLPTPFGKGKDPISQLDAGATPSRKISDYLVSSGGKPSAAKKSKTVQAPSTVHSGNDKPTKPAQEPRKTVAASKTANAVQPEIAKAPKPGKLKPKHSAPPSANRLPSVNDPIHADLIPNEAQKKDLNRLTDSITHRVGVSRGALYRQLQAEFEHVETEQQKYERLHAKYGAAPAEEPLESVLYDKHGFSKHGLPQRIRVRKSDKKETTSDPAKRKPAASRSSSPETRKKFRAGNSDTDDQSEVDDMDINSE